MRYDEILIDVPLDIGNHRFSEQEILAFARDFDPQPFHIDHSAARDSHFGGIIASGWHVCAVWMRLTVDHWQAQGSVAGISPGMEHIRWLKPVRPGDHLTFQTHVSHKRRLKSRPGWAVITCHSEAVNQNGEIAFEMKGNVLFPIDD
ncbi:MaoC family dehydratase [Oryzibacter oryziterrae]|uniref:MaoC family dehydratase n=1 Tax=Oryzibacter oryziterrae TaxID=2766474 RepID=UPI001F32ED18|nr:MaoC family dehydratase [Oryzibacter oryziterrae]